MSDTVGDWLRLVHDRYPPSHAADWDNVGLQVGDPAWEIDRVLVTLDVTSAVIDEASSGPATLVLAHHPLLFRPLKRLAPDTPSGKLALKAARNGVAVAAAHTNLDVASDGAGTSDPVARILELEDTRSLTTELRDSSEVKLVVFIPPSHTDVVLDAVSEAGAGVIGDYERCSYRLRGVGTFRPGTGTDPYTGTVGQDNAEEEDRLEVVAPRRLLGRIVAALVASHPYEEVAYDVYPLVDGATVGFGIVGKLSQPMSLRAVAARLRDELPAPHLRFAGNPERIIRRVATVGGAGDSLIGAAIAADVDAYVTGDLRHHVTLDALEQGLALVDAGHHATEAAAIPAWIQQLEAEAGARSLEAEVIASTVRTVPWA